MTALLTRDQPFRLDRLAELGLDPPAFARRRRAGAYRRVLRGVYVDAAVPDSRSVRTAAAKLIRPPDGVLMGCSAAWVMGVDTFAPSARFDLTPDWMVPHGSTRSVRRGVRFVEGYLRPEDVLVMDGLPVTTPTRTASDLLRRLRRPWALAAADGLTHAGLTTPADIEAYLARLRGYPGIVQARELVLLVEPRSESAGESVQRLRLVDGGLGRPEPQYVVLDRTGRTVGRVDHAYVAQRVICEHDGVEFHSHPDDKTRDERRRWCLTEVLGWRLVVTTGHDLFGKDNAFEREVGAYLGIEPGPRLW
jgi:hypothetical protein